MITKYRRRTMVRSNKIKKTAGKLLNSTEHKAISKLMKMHQPILSEMEKWKEQREKLETKLLDQLEAIGEILEPYYKQSQYRLQEAFGTISGQRKSSAKYP